MKGERGAGVRRSRMVWATVGWMAVALSGSAGAEQMDWTVHATGQASGRMEWVKDLELLSPGSSPPEDPHPALYLAASLTAKPVEAVMGRITLGSREISRQTLDDGRVEARWEGNRFVDEAFVRLKDERMWLRVGKQRVVTGDGMILDDYQPAVAAGTTWGGEASTRVRLRAVAARLDEDGALRPGQSLHAALTVELVPSLFRRVWVSVARLWDRDGLIDRVMPQAVILARRDLLFDPEGGHVTWWVAGGEALVRGWTVRGLGIVQRGGLDVIGRDATGLGLPQTRSIRVEGLAGSFRASYAVTDPLTVGGFALYTSGDGRRPIEVWQEERYEGFLGIFPLIDTTSLFFRGGISQSFETGRTATSGVDGRGVAALGTEGKWERSGFSSRVVVAHLWSEHPPTTGDGRNYGWEVDTEAAYRAAPWATVWVEGDLLVPGSFFQDQTSPPAETVTKAVVGLDVSF